VINSSPVYPKIVAVWEAIRQEKNVLASVNLLECPSAPVGQVRITHE